MMSRNDAEFRQRKLERAYTENETRKRLLKEAREEIQRLKAELKKARLQNRLSPREEERALNDAYDRSPG